MAKKVEQMLHRAMEAFARQDSHLAQTVARQDEGIDYLYQHIYQEMIAIIKVNPAAVSQAFDVSQVGHHLERIADRVTNVCEWVVFSVTGEMKELNGTIN